MFKNTNTSLNFRLLKDKAFYISILILTFLMSIPLLAIIVEVAVRGYKQINLDFFTKVAPSTLEAMIANSSGTIIPGGILNGIVGTVFIVGLASIAAIPMGLFAGIYLAEKPKHWFSNILRFLTELIQGTPSIIIGVITYSWVVIPLKSYSIIAGSTALTIMMLPLIIRSTEETIKMLPTSLKEAGLALGCSYSSVILKIIVPSALNGLITGILLSISRVMGETAPLMLTTLGASAVSLNLDKPSSAIPLLIWEFYNDPNLVNLIWSSALFLLIIILTLNILAKYLVHKSNR